MTKIVLCGALFSLISLSAQDTAAVEKKIAEAKAQLDGFTVLGASMISGPTVKGAPYSAQAVNETEHALADGNLIKNSNSSMLYRDSQGRERREESSNGTVRSVFISDPVDGVSYTLTPQSKTAHKSGQRNVGITFSGGSGSGGGAAVGVGVAHGSGTFMSETHSIVMNSSGGDAPGTFVFSNQEMTTARAKPVVEHLGTQMMEGVSAEGTRTTVTIPAGQIGNELPLVTVTERWYSPELQVTVMNKRSDPRTGTTTYKLTNINRSEPSPLMFQVPADYTVNEPFMIRRDTKPEEQQ
jgi:hypothetical protein